MSGETLMSNYKSQLNTRFYSNSISLQVLACLILIFIFAIEVAKFFKKTYEWQADYELRIEQRYTEESKSILRERSQAEQVVPKEEEKGGRVGKKEAYVPSVVVIEEIIKNKLPQIAIIAINVVTIASYQFCAIVSYISIVMIFVAQVVGSEHVKLKLGLQVVSKVLLISLYVNALTVAKPSR